jgi:hypothetical protein
MYWPPPPAQYLAERNIILYHFILVVRIWKNISTGYKGLGLGWSATTVDFVQDFTRSVYVTIELPMHWPEPAQLGPLFHLIRESMDL